MWRAPAFARDVAVVVVGALVVYALVWGIGFVLDLDTDLVVYSGLAVAWLAALILFTRNVGRWMLAMQDRLTAVERTLAATKSEAGVDNRVDEPAKGRPA